MDLNSVYKQTNNQPTRRYRQKISRSAQQQARLKSNGNIMPVNCRHDRAIRGYLPPAFRRIVKVMFSHASVCPLLTVLCQGVSPGLLSQLLFGEGVPLVLSLVLSGGGGVRVSQSGSRMGTPSTPLDITPGQGCTPPPSLEKDQDRGTPFLPPSLNQDGALPPPPFPTGHVTDTIRRGRYTSCDHTGLSCPRSFFFFQINVNKTSNN